jgi:hypothetical protein
MIVPNVAYPIMGGMAGAIFGWTGMLIVRNVTRHGTPAAVASAASTFMFIALVAVAGVAWCFGQALDVQGIDLSKAEALGYAFGLVSLISWTLIAMLAGLGAESWRRRRSSHGAAEAAATNVRPSGARDSQPTHAAALPYLPKTFTAKPENILQMIFGSVLLATYGLWVRTAQPIKGDIAIAFALLSLVLTIRIFFSRGFALKLTKEGFLASAPFRTTFVPWNGIAAFAINSTSKKRLVGWRYKPGFRQPGLVEKYSRRLIKADGLLPSNYGMQPEELCHMLDALRLRNSDNSPGVIERPDSQARLR